MRGGQVLSYGGEVVKEALVGKEETGAKAMVQTEGMLQTVVRHQKCLSLVNKVDTQRRKKICRYTFVNYIFIIRDFCWVTHV